MVLPLPVVVVVPAKVESVVVLVVEMGGGRDTRSPEVVTTLVA